MSNNSGDTTMPKSDKKLYIDSKYRALDAFSKPIHLFVQETNQAALENELIEYDEIFITRSAVEDFGHIFSDFLDADAKEMLGIDTEDVPHEDEWDDEMGSNERRFQTVDGIDILHADDTLVVIDAEDDFTLIYGSNTIDELELKANVYD